MRRARHTLLVGFAVLACALDTAPADGGQVRTGATADGPAALYVEERGLPQVEGRLRSFMQDPVDLLQWTQAAAELRPLADTEAFKTLLFSQALTTAQIDRPWAKSGASAVDFICT